MQGIALQDRLLAAGTIDHIWLLIIRQAVLIAACKQAYMLQYNISIAIRTQAASSWVRNSLSQVLT